MKCLLEKTDGTMGLVDNTSETNQHGAVCTPLPPFRDPLVTQKYHMNESLDTFPLGSLNFECLAPDNIFAFNRHLK